LDFVPYQDAAEHFPDVSMEQFQGAIHLMMPEGARFSGADAMFRMMSAGGLVNWPAWMYRNVPPAKWISDAAYRWIASHRRKSLGVSRLMFGAIHRPSTLLLTRRVFLRLLGLIYIAAFLSFGQQAMGLIGSNGIQPTQHLMEAAAVQDLSWWQFPTFQWFGGDAVLNSTWIIGSLCAVLLVLGWVPLVSAVGCWIAYLSLTTASGVFLQFQWDALLLECGVLAALWAPATVRLNSPSASRPSRLVHWLIVLVLARLVFFGGLAKLQSNDPTWADCTALSYHFWTQPLPWWPAWIASELSPWILRTSCSTMFLIELICPFLLFGPRMLRTLGTGIIALLMIGIAVTGNYGFFNWLALVLCIAMLDDATLLTAWPRVSRTRILVGLRPLPGMIARWSRNLIATMILILVIFSIRTQLTQKPLEGSLANVTREIAPWRPVGQYGLFATMTTMRPEIRIDWKDEKGEWHPIIFSWKPGPLDRVGAFCQPYMPRLDWHLWFDALRYEQAFLQGLLTQSNPIPVLTRREVLPSLLVRILEAEPSVCDLLEKAPDAKPHAVRWHLDQYRFTTSEERAETGNWWQSERMFSSPELGYPSSR